MTAPKGQAPWNEIKRLREINAVLYEALRDAAADLEGEADNYRDGDAYQPHGKTLLAAVKKARAALAKVGAP